MKENMWTAVTTGSIQSNLARLSWPLVICQLMVGVDFLIKMLPLPFKISCFDAEFI